MRTRGRVVSIAAVVLATAALLPGQARPAGRGSTSLATLGSGVLAALNEIRVAHGLVPVKVSAGLSAAASEHATQMLGKGYFEHESADGVPFGKWIARFYPEGVYQRWSVGENLLWSDGPLDAKGALTIWMASPEHRANILSPRWREVGIAALYERNAPGAFGGNAVTLVATDFGARS